MTLVVKMEAMAGDHINDVCQEISDAAIRLGVYVEVTFNDVTLRCRPGSSGVDVLNGYNREVSSGTEIKMAVV